MHTHRERRTWRHELKNFPRVTNMFYDDFSSMAIQFMIFNAPIKKFYSKLCIEAQNTETMLIGLFQSQ